MNFIDRGMDVSTFLLFI